MISCKNRRHHLLLAYVSDPLRHHHPFGVLAGRVSRDRLATNTGMDTFMIYDLPSLVHLKLDIKDNVYLTHMRLFDSLKFKKLINGIS